MAGCEQRGSQASKDLLVIIGAVASGRFVPHTSHFSKLEEEPTKEDSLHFGEARDESRNAIGGLRRYMVNSIPFLISLSRVLEKAQDVDLLGIRESTNRWNVHLTTLHNIQSLHVLHRLSGDMLANQQGRPDLTVGHEIQHMTPNRCRQVRDAIIVRTDPLGLALPRCFIAHGTSVQWSRLLHLLISFHHAANVHVPMAASCMHCGWVWRFELLCSEYEILFAIRKLFFLIMVDCPKNGGSLASSESKKTARRATEQSSEVSQR